MLLIGHRELIGNQNAIDTALLQRFEIALVTRFRPGNTVDRPAEDAGAAFR